MVSADDQSGKIKEGSPEHAKAIAENERIYSDDATALARRELGAEIVNWSNSQELAPEADLPRPAAGRIYTDDDLREIVDFDAFLDHLGSTAISADDYIGSGATVLLGDERMQLVGEPFIILQFNFTRGDFGGYYAYVEVLTKHNHRYAFMSGAQFSIRDQLAQIAIQTQQFHGIVCRKGLKMRSYPYPKVAVPGEKQIEVKVYSIAPVGKDQ